MLSEKLTKAINKQINYELFSGHVYVAMAAWCADNDLPGFTNFFIVQEQEERFHAMKFFNFLTEMDQKPIMTGMPDPDTDFDSLEDVFATALEHEKGVTARIYDLMDIAQEEKEYRTVSMLNWFVDEQREEEDTFSGLLAMVKRVEGHGNQIYHLDKELGARTFTPPADEG